MEFYFIFFLRREKSTAIVNLAITHELPQRMWKIHKKPGVYILGFLVVTLWNIEPDPSCFILEINHHHLKLSHPVDRGFRN